MNKTIDSKILSRNSISGEDRFKIERFWKEQLSLNPRLYNGTVFGVDNIRRENGKILLDLFRSDFAHYLYTQKIGDLGDNNLVNIYCSLVVSTNDDFIVLGKMNKHTAFPGLIQFCGGGIGEADVFEGSVDFEKCIKREISEELYLSDCEPGFEDVFEFPEQNKVSVVFGLKLNMEREEFQLNFEKNKDPHSEFAEIIFVRKDTREDLFLSDEEIEILVKKYFKLFIFN
jgi:8-oxo-dGTP pyrophosphatase MutT (NUDIX family)